VIGTLGYGHFGWNGSIDFTKQVYIKSLLKLSTIDFDVMLPGHGLGSFTNPRERVEESLNEALMTWR
jgi:glyoxylase-like metal-dependent hydrolase (beta-lactamase superfamily II)